MKKLNDAINICLTTIGERPLGTTIVEQGDSYFHDVVVADLPAWSNTKAYSIDDEVKDGSPSVWYVAKTAHTGSTPPNATNWAVGTKELKVYTGTAWETASTSSYTASEHYWGALFTQTTRPPTASVVTPITGIYEAELADIALNEARVELLGKGYSFNTDIAWQMMPDATDTIVMPYGALSVDATAADSNYIIKDNKLYDKGNHTHTFTEVVEADVIWDIEFDDLPSHAQVAIVDKAKAKLYSRVVGVSVSDGTARILKEEMAVSNAALLSEEMRIGNYSIYDDGSSNRAMTRSRNPSGL